MAKTRGSLIAEVQRILGDDSTASLNYLQIALDDVLSDLWEAHDWTFRHKTGAFNSVVGQEEYDLTSTSADIRSSRDIEILYNTTKGQKLHPVTLREIRIAYPKEDQDSEPLAYAPWGTKSIILSPNPIAVEAYKYGYIAKPTLPTADGDDIETVTGTPDYVHTLLKAMLTYVAMEEYDDNRYAAKGEEIRRVRLPAAIAADMRYLEHDLRIRHWDEELTGGNPSYDDFLRHTWWGGLY